MKLILITLVALVVGLMVGCGGGDSRVTDVNPVPTVPASAPTVPASAPYVPRYTDEQVFGFIQKHLSTTEYDSNGKKCTNNRLFAAIVRLPTFLRDRSTVRNTGPQEQYYVTLSYDGQGVTGPVDFTGTFFGDSGQVLATSKIYANHNLRVC